MQKVILLCGLAFGDEAKGAITEALVAKHAAKLVVRYNGGPQAAHTVVEPNRTHVFAQMGAGTLLGARTHLSNHMLVCPFRLRSEAAHLDEIGIRLPLDLVTIDKRAPLVTPVHKLACQIEELARGFKHGSTGMGIWATTKYARQFPLRAPRMGDLCHINSLMDKIAELRLHYLWTLCDETVAARGTPQYAATHKAYEDLDNLDLAELRDRYAELSKYSSLGQFALTGSEYLAEQLREGITVFEGAQGVLLDENYGFHPHTTGSTTTFANADEILRAAGYDGEVERVGVLRSYMTRHGQGPLVTEIASPVEELHNKSTDWAGPFRAGPLDLVMLRYALKVCGGVDTLAISHMDQYAAFGKVCTGYLAMTNPSDQKYLVGGRRLQERMPSDLNYQAEMTKALGGMFPRYERWNEHLPEMIGEWLGTNVGIVSSGPTRDDKVFLDDGPN